jgi:hypothetical protein
MANEQIKQLIGQTLDEKFAGTWSVMDMQDLTKFADRFAQLIVQECLKKVEEEYKPVLEDKEMMKDTHWDGYVQCGVDSYVAIREHFFGVEE